MGFIEAREQFLQAFDGEQFAKFRTAYESITHPPETLNIAYNDTEKLLRDFLTNDTSEKRQFIETYLPQLGTFLQGPFPLPGGKIVRSVWDCRGKIGNWSAVGVVPQLSGARAIDVGCNAGYDSFLMKGFGAKEVVGIERASFVHQARFLNSIYETNIDFRKASWRDLAGQEYFQQFDFVNCQGLIYHVKDPLVLLALLAKILRPGGTLLLETHVLSESSEMAQIIEKSFWNDETYWWIFGDECVKSMLRASGFTDIQLVSKIKADSRNPENPDVTIEGYDAGARAFFTATRNDVTKGIWKFQ